MSHREQLGRSITIEQTLKNDITELEKAKYGAMAENANLKSVVAELRKENLRLTQLLQNSRAE